jgi:hypothetical protein
MCVSIRPLFSTWMSASQVLLTVTQDLRLFTAPITVTIPRYNLIFNIYFLKQNAEKEKRFDFDFLLKSSCEFIKCLETCDKNTQKILTHASNPYIFISISISPSLTTNGMALMLTPIPMKDTSYSPLFWTISL